MILEKTVETNIREIAEILIKFFRRENHFFPNATRYFAQNWKSRFLLLLDLLDLETPKAESDHVYTERLV